VSTYKRGTSTRRGRAGAIAFVLLGVALAAVAAPAGAGTADVTIANMAFSPETVTVELAEGEPEFPGPHAHVNWLMRDEGVEHTVSFDNRSLGSGSSGRLGPGQVHSVVFEEPGTFLYRCELHSNMTGVVVVTAPPAADEGDDGSGTNVAIVIGGATLAAATVAAAIFLVRRPRRAGGAQGTAKRPTR
jgi:plastocyanin